MTISNARGDQVTNLSIAAGIVNTCAVGLRLLVRWKSKVSLGLDDGFIVASLVPLYGMITASALLVKDGGLGLHAETLAPTTLTSFLKILMSTIITYSLTTTVVRLSVLLLYRRLFCTKNFRSRSLVAGVACVLGFFAEILTGIFQCRPFRAAFDPDLIFTDHCISLQAYYWGVTAANLGLNLIILCLPVYEIWRLDLDLRQRLGLIGVFLLGGLGCLAGIVRLVALKGIQHNDITYSMHTQFLWSQTEPALAMFCACLISYGPLVQRFCHKAASMAILRRSYRRTKQTWTGIRFPRWSPHRTRAKHHIELQTGEPSQSSSHSQQKRAGQMKVNFQAPNSVQIKMPEPSVSVIVIPKTDRLIVVKVL